MDKYYIIKNHPELKHYLITEDAKIYSNITNQFIDPYIYNEYKIIYLENKKYFVHNLMAETFLSDDTNILLNEVIHIDGNKINNHKDNLKWNNEEFLDKDFLDRYHRLFQCTIS